jgi:hypothetical protein
MGLYGISYYGTTEYGTNAISVDYSALPFKTTPVGYSAIELTWNVPTSSAQASWNAFRLVRNKYGYPLSIEDGDTILSYNTNVVPNSYIDRGSEPSNVGLQPGTAYYYSIFVYSTTLNTWQLSGQAAGISVKSYAGEAAVDLLPDIYRNNDLNTAFGSTGNPDLESFMLIFDYYLDFLKTLTDLAKSSYDTSKTFYPVIPVMFQQFGLTFEPELGYQRARSQLNNVSLINQLKGSVNGIKSYIKTFTGWSPIISMNKNIMLSSDDSSFETGTGNWAARDTSSNGPTLSWSPAASITPYAESTLALTNPNSQLGSLSVKLNSASSPEITVNYANPMLQGIPVLAGTVYTFSMYCYSQTATRTMSTKIYWFDRKGILLSNTTASTATSTTTAWGLRLTNSGTAPTGAYFAVPSITIQNGASGEFHYFDAGQFEAASSATSFVEARGLNIILVANRVNELTNPNFESSVSPWIATNGTLSLDNVNYETDTGTSHQSLKMTATGTSPLSVTYGSNIPVLSGFYYTFSTWAMTQYVGSLGSDKTGYLSINWYTSSDQLISTSSELSHPWTEYYTPISYSVKSSLLTINFVNDLEVGNTIYLINFGTGIDGVHSIVTATSSYVQVYVSHVDVNTTTATNQLIQNQTSDFSRFSFSALSPANAAYAKVSFNWTNPTNGTGTAKNLWIDSAMFEQAGAASDYFDGSGGFSAPADIFWEGATNASRSHYYKNYTSASHRLKTDLVNYLMNGTTYKFLVAQPGVLS